MVKAATSYQWSDMCSIQPHAPSGFAQRTRTWHAHALAHAAWSQQLVTRIGEAGVAEWLASRERERAAREGDHLDGEAELRVLLLPTEHGRLPLSSEASTEGDMSASDLDTMPSVERSRLGRPPCVAGSAHAAHAAKTPATA